MKTARVKGEFLIKQKETESKSQNIIFISRVRRFNLDAVHFFFLNCREQNTSSIIIQNIFLLFFQIKTKIFCREQKTTQIIQNI